MRRSRRSAAHRHPRSALIGALLGLSAAGLGGIVGTRRAVALDRTTSEVTYERR